MHIKNKLDCTGCGACYNICPKDAIAMQGNEYGFYKPVIDKDKCISCGLCEKVCPLDKYKSKNFKEPKVFAFMNNDEIRAKSSSGGAFSAFADYVLEQNGAIYGVVWDENIRAIHYRATNTDDVEKMHGSKYVQSNTKNTFKQTKEDLENNKFVLFSGTPCQIAGLKSYLQKSYDNLLTVDLVCHGVQSPLFLEKYIQYLKKSKKTEKITDVNFRSKHIQWGNGYFTTITTDKGVYHNGSDAYTANMDLDLNQSCLKCEFTGIPRIADITIGDFWGVDNYNKNLNDGKGTSIVILNSDFGKNIFEKIKNKYIYQEIPLYAATKYNPNLLFPSPLNPKRTEFLEKLIKPENSFRELSKKPFYIELYRLLPQFVKDFIKYKILKREKC